MQTKIFLEKNKVFFQMAYGIFLVVLVPILIAYNTIYIINTYSESIDAVIQRNGLSIGRSVYALIKNDIDNNEALQSKIESLISKNSSILGIDVLKPDKDEFVVVASSDDEKLNASYKYEYYNLAWTQPDNDGLATDFIRFPEKNEEILEPKLNNRFWLIAMPMTDDNGDKQALLTVQLSSDIIDNLIIQNRNSSILVLVVTVLIVLLFLMIAVRLWDYALLYRKIKEVDKMKDEFISMASHELRTPVTAIRGYASLILEGGLGDVNEEVKKRLSNIENSAKRLNTLVEDLLEVSRIEQGRMEISSAPTDIDPLIKNVIENLMGQASEKNLSLKYLPHSKKLPLLNVDSGRFTQILFNLIGNAVKYTPKGTVEVFTEAKNRGNTLAIKIKDSGIGMSSEERKNLFNKFYRVKNKQTEHIGGTGLGLWITKEMVSLMNGQISVDSIEGVGTQVTISFPVEKFIQH